MNMRIASILIPALGLALAACPNDDDTDTDTDSDGPAFLECDDAGTECFVSGTIDQDFTFTSDVTWVLNGAVFVGEDTEADGGGTAVTLTVDPGTTVYGRTGNRSFLAVSRGSELVAEGTASAPILFTSGAGEGSRNPGDWGGIILNGKGLHNQCSDPTDCNVESEGNAGFYGGDDNADSSGSLEYVIVTHAGDQVTEDDQLNGIAFQAVGSGTNVDYIQVHRNADDGIEFFGGAAQVKHVVITGAHDDSIDWTSGWTGKLQHAVVHQWDDKADRGIEADNNEDDNSATPRSKPIMSHVTLIGSKAAPEGDDGAKLRRGTAGEFWSFLIVNFGGNGVDIDDDETYNNTWDGSTFSGELVFANSIIADTNNDALDEDDGAPFLVADWFAAGVNNVVGEGAATDYVGSVDPSNPDWASKGNATTGGGGPSDSWFDNGSHIGGVGATNWTDGWIVLDAQ